MGEARKKLMDAAKLVKFDFGAPEFVMHQNDFRDAPAETRKILAVKRLINELVAAKFPQGMDRTAGKVWAAWQESINQDGGPSVVQMTKSQLDWLGKIARADELQLGFAFAQWREALVDYIDSIEPVSSSPQSVEQGV